MAAPRPLRPNPFSAVGLDRLADVRKDAETLARRLPDAVLLPVWQGRVCTQGQPPDLVRLDVGEFAERVWLLGEVASVTYVAVELHEEEFEDAGVPEGARWSSLREIGHLLPAEDAHLLATATALATWHRTHHHCGSCGSATVADWGGHRRMCESCGREHFPRTDPAIIVLVTHGDRALLARNPAWPVGFASVLAGFVEPGESLEDAVRREVKEEVGLDLDDLEYQSSQPWPFPQSIMLGFRATAAGDALRPDPEEVADACWYSRDEVRHGAVGLPGPVSIARRLIDDWLAEE